MDFSAIAMLMLLGWPLFNLLLAAYVPGLTAWLDNRAFGRRFQMPVETFWIVVPCLNEEVVIARTVRAALDLSAPGTRTEVLVVDDASNDRTPRVLADIAHARLHVLRRELPDARRGKGEALNAAYAYICAVTEAAGQDPRRVVVGVLDGDGRGDANMLVEVGRSLVNPNMGAVQCQVRIHNRDRLLGAVQDLEFACVADAGQTLRHRLGSVGLGGNGQFIRLSALQLLGDRPWSGCLVEDLEVGLRLHLAGVGVGYVWRTAVTQQGVTDVRRLLRQRTRWAQGNLQCIRYLPKVWTSPRIRNHALVEIAFYLLAPWLNAITGVVVLGALGSSLVGLANGDLGAQVGLHGVLGVLAWFGALLVPGLGWAVQHRLRHRDESLPRLIVAGLVYPAFLMLGLISTWRALGRQLIGRGGWAKTERIAEDPEAFVLPPAPAPERLPAVPAAETPAAAGTRKPRRAKPSASPSARLRQGSAPRPEVEKAAASALRRAEPGPPLPRRPEPSWSPADREPSRTR